jgi:hypothetical protein
MMPWWVWLVAAACVPTAMLVAWLLNKAVRWLGLDPWDRGGK